jgi:hypothetical protein
MIWWILGSVGGILLLLLLWFAGSYLYLKLTYGRRSNRERLLFSDLEKEQRTPHSGSS